MFKRLPSTRFFLFISVLLLPMACAPKKAPAEKMNAKKAPSLHFLTVNRQNVKTLIPDLCDSFAIEFNGLHNDVDSLPLLTQDSSYLDKILVEMGFTITNTGGGNWQDGPRFIEVDLVRGDCYCSVYKKYYAKNDRTHLNISERLICNTETINAVQSN